MKHLNRIKMRHNPKSTTMSKCSVSMILNLAMMRETKTKTIKTVTKEDNLMRNLGEPTTLATIKASARVIMLLIQAMAMDLRSSKVTDHPNVLLRDKDMVAKMVMTMDVTMDVTMAMAIDKVIPTAIGKVVKVTAASAVDKTLISRTEEVIDLSNSAKTTACNSAEATVETTAMAISAVAMIPISKTEVVMVDKLSANNTACNSAEAMVARTMAMVRAMAISSAMETTLINLIAVVMAVKKDAKITGCLSEEATARAKVINLDT